jgi:hypothetical protein
MITASTLATSTITQTTSSAIEASSIGLYKFPRPISTTNSCFLNWFLKFSLCSPTTTSITPAASQAPKLPSEIIGKIIEEVPLLSLNYLYCSQLIFTLAITFLWATCWRLENVCPDICSSFSLRKK